jgi:choline-sulfatase
MRSDSPSSLCHGQRLDTKGSGHHVPPENAKKAEREPMIGVRVLATICGCSMVSMLACGEAKPTVKLSQARHLVLITIDTLRADHVGAYGYTRARTPTLDGLARGALFERAYAAAPITLTSHATILTGRYPPGHGARDNGLRMSADVPTLATVLHSRGFKTAAFVAAFPLDHQFGLDRGFDVYSDRLGRGPDGRPANERPASAVITEAITWLGTVGAQNGRNGQDGRDRRDGPDGVDRMGRERQAPAQSPTSGGSSGPADPAPPAPRFFLWIHLFEPHAPYGEDTSRPVLARYDDEIATVDREVGRLLTALGDRLGETVVVAAGDHGEAFGEHGEYAHSIFVYDTTLHVPLIMRVPGMSARRGDIAEPVTLADVAPTVARLLGVEMKDTDGIDLTPALEGTRLPARELYAESFAPLVEFGWAPLRAIRSEQWKFIAAPQPELYDTSRDATEQTNLASTHEPVVRRLDNRVNRYSGAGLGAQAAANPSAAERLRALGYSGGSRRDEGGNRPDPKDRRELAGRIAQVTSGELTGSALLSALEGIVRDDPRNGQAHLRLGYARLQAGDCGRAMPEFQAALAAGLSSADAYLGLATCLGQSKDLDGAGRALAEARRLEPDNPAIRANLGILKAARGDTAGAIRELQGALAADPNLHEARFNLALVYARAGRRSDAAGAARELLARLPPTAPQRSEIQRLLQSLQ